MVEEILQANENYWRKVLLQEITVEEGYPVWFDSLAKIALQRGRKFDSFSDQEAEDLVKFIKNELKKDGFYSQIGRTKPHMDLMIWRKQSIESYTVDLGDAKIIVPVVMMDDFLTFGWLGFATFNYKYTGGWADEEKLYCVKPAYDITSESFHISYLAHEGRHFSDQKRFPKLESIDLEYRAKLTELSLAKSTANKTLKHFLSESSEDRSSAHAFASKMVIQNLSAQFNDALTVDKIDSLKINDINRFSRLLLDEHNKQLNLLGASITKGVYSNSKK